MIQSINWNDIRLINGSQKEGFEELVCQLARNENIENSKLFIRKGTPDAGVECFWVLTNEDEIGYQAKFFTNPLTATQWSELDESVKTALDKHPKITKYIISIPQDRADARIKGRKSFLEKWNDSVEKWNGWAKDDNRKVEFIYEGTSELLDKLSKPENIGKTLFWFNQDEYTNNWFFKQNQSKIKDLGARYSPEINIDLSIKYIFDGLYLNSNYKNKVDNNIEKANKKFEDFIKFCDDISPLKNALKDIYDQLIEVLGEINLEEINKFDKLKDLYSKTYLFTTSRCQQYINDIEDSEKKKIYKSHFNDFVYSINDVKNSLHNFDTKLANDPCLIIEGDAGIGKSHLIADVINEKFNNHQFSILLLGQHFYASSDIWTQIKNQLEIKNSKEEFLGALNSKAESINTRIIIYIDAINEGEGKYLWKDQLFGLIADIKQFPNIGLVLTIRNTYKDIVLPENIFEEIPNFEHRGFEDTYQATKVFFEYYEIQEPPIPLLNPEFNNPLFLKLFCKGLSDNGVRIIPQDYDNLNTIFSYLIEAVNKSLSNKFDYNYKDFNLVSEAVSLLSSKLIVSPSFQISRKQAYNLLTNELKNHVDNSRNILTELICENILTENVIYNFETEKYDKEIIYFSYERLGDYLVAQTLLNQDIDKIRESKKIDSDMRMYQFIKDNNRSFRNQGIIEALSILLPERTKLEFYELVDNNEDDQIGKAFLKSLIWRNSNSINGKINEYLNNYILKIHDLKNSFLEILIQLSLRKDHYLNAYFLNDFLLGMELNQRDYIWTIYSNNSYTALIFSHWILESKTITTVDEETKKLISLILTWFLTSSNRELRDISTKALVKIFQDHLSLLERLIKFMENVNDLYVLERLYAASYGAVLRTKDEKLIKNFALFIYHHVFEKKNPIEHLLLRDYARGVVEYANQKKLIDDIEISKVRPPYQSKMPLNIPTEEEIEKYKSEKEEGFNIQNSLFNLIVGDSDFAKYTFGTDYYSKISNIKIESYIIYNEVYNSSEKNKKELQLFINNCKNYKSEFTNQKFKDLFKYFYDNLESFLITIFKLTEKEAKLLSEYIKTITDDYFSNNKKFDTSILQRLIVEDVFNTYGWENELFEEHDYINLRDAYFDKKTYSKNESIGKKYIWISYHRWRSVILDNYIVELDYSNDDRLQIYNGTWNLHFSRDIDPTFLDDIVYKEQQYKNSDITFWFPENKINWKNEDNKKWSLDINDIIHPKELINIKDEDGNEWLNLYSYPSWYENNDIGDMGDSRKQIWYHIKSYIINTKDKQKIINSLNRLSFFNGQILKEQDIHDVYSREYYWSEAYKDNTYNEGNSILHSQILDKKISGFSTSINYIWYKDHDFSLKQDVFIKRPTKFLFDILNLEYEDNEHYFYNKDGELVVFDPSIKYQNGNSCLLVKKDFLINKLYSKGLDIIWLVLGAKEVIIDNRIVFEGDINSVFSLDSSGDIIGDLEITPYKKN